MWVHGVYYMCMMYVFGLCVWGVGGSGSPTHFETILCSDIDSS